MQAAISIPRNFIHGDELMIVRRKDYEKMQKHLAEVCDALGKIRRGEKEHREGKTISVKSLSELRK